MFFQKSDLGKQKRPCQECTTQKSGVGMHQKPPFSIKHNTKLEKAENQDWINNFYF